MMPPQYCLIPIGISGICRTLCWMSEMKNMRALLAITLLLGMVLTACGQPLPEPADVIALYEGVAPGSEGWDWEEKNLQSRAGLPMTQNVVKP